MQLITQRIPGIKKLKLDSKRLASGKYQVKYEVEIQGKKDRYGYLLSDPKQTMEDTINDIVSKAGAQESHLFAVRKQHQQQVVEFEIP